MGDAVNIFFNNAVFLKKEWRQSLTKKPKAQIETNIKETPYFNSDIDLIYQEEIKSPYLNIVRILQRI